MHEVAVHGQRLHVAVGHHQDGAARGLVDPAALHADETVLDQIDPADAVLAGQLVQCLHHRGGLHRLAVDRHAVAALEVEFDVFGLVRRVLGGGGQLEHGLVVLGRRVEPGVFEDARLVGNVQEVAVHRVGLGSAGLDVDVVGAAILDHLLAAGEGLAEDLHAPGGNDLQFGREGPVGQLEAHLVVPFPGRSVGDGVGPLLLRDLHMRLGDERTRDRGAEVVLAFIDRVGAHHREDEITGELID